MKTHLPSILLLSMLALTDVAQASQQRHIIFSCQEPAGSPIFEMLTVIYRHAFSLNGYSFEMISTPSKRAIHEVITENVDGICGVSQELNASVNSPSITLANTALGRLSLNAYYLKGTPPITSLADLNNPNFRIGVSAWGISHKLLERNNIAYTEVASIDLALRMLAAGRLDYTVNSHFVVSRILKEIKSRKTIIKSSPLHESNVYPLLHVRHKPILEGFDRELTKILNCVGEPISARTMGLWKKIVLDQGINKYCSR